MSKSKPPRRTESVRLGPIEAEFIDAWCRSTGQDRSLVLRAAIRAFAMDLTGSDIKNAMLAVAEMGNFDESMVSWQTLLTLQICRSESLRRFRGGVESDPDPKHRVSVDQLVLPLKIEGLRWDMDARDRLKSERHGDELAESEPVITQLEQDLLNAGKKGRADRN